MRARGQGEVPLNRTIKWQVLLGVLAAALAFAPAAHAATISVTTPADELDADGNCSLREALKAANTDAAVDACTKGAGADTIKLPGGLYRSSSGLATTGEDNGLSGDLDITAPITIKGAGAVTTIVDANQLDRVFEVRPSVTATLSGLTITGGKPPLGSDGGGILIDSGATLVLAVDLVSKNQAESGGGVRVGDGGALTTSGSAVTGNSASAAGGGIAHIGTTATLKNSIVAGNSANHGGGITNGMDGGTSTMSIVGGAISGNQATASGGGIDTLAKLALTDVEISGDHAGGSGGGLFVEIHTPPVTLTRTTVSRNTTDTGPGGGIDNDNVLSIADSAVSGNHGGENGGGIANTSALTVDRSTVSGNLGDDGDGIYNIGAATLTNSTVSGNGSISPGGQGGGIFNYTGKSLTLRNDTIYQNTASSSGGDGGNLYNDGTGTISAKNTLVANPLTSGNCAGTGTLTSLGNNLGYDSSGDTYPCFTMGGGNVLGADPVLGPLQNNGGPTQTHALGSGSGALNAGSDCEATDQRGVPRSRPICEIGAYELASCHGAVVNVVGTTGKNRLVGTSAGESFLALAANDTIIGGGGRDRICAGKGSDKILSRGDGAKDTDDCGPGSGDKVKADGKDRLIGCEKVL